MEEKILSLHVENLFKRYQDKLSELRLELRASAAGRAAAPPEAKAASAGPAAWTAV